MGNQVVWLKKDLRVRDHASLTEAAAAGPCVVLYIYEPEITKHPTYDAAHHRFIEQSLTELEAELESRGGRLVRREGEAVEVLDRLHDACRFEALWSHEETGHAVSFARDLRVKAWCKSKGVAWHERRQTGVIRGLKDRDGWARRWQRTMSAPIVEPPERIAPVDGVESTGPRSAEILGLPATTMNRHDPGGESVGHAMLESFLQERGVNYRADMSSPVEGWEGCSRLSAYLTFGNVSIRQAYQATRARVAELKEKQKSGEKFDRRWFGSLKSYEARLRWHCHFTQKFESEPDIESRNMNRAYDGLRGDSEENPFGDVDPAKLDAWKHGQTGYPLIDACMRCLAETGWLNFRMRAMLASFTSYHLWMHWKAPADFLATRFIDFEPGIHYSQYQMQSGVTGINTVRIYSPIKQAKDQDPNGVFIRRWVPELAEVPDKHLAEPHKLPPMAQRLADCEIGKHYPPPIVDHATAYREAKEKTYRRKGQKATRAASKLVYAKHGSRKRGRAQRVASGKFDSAD
ncbi:MAG: FAD-binding domain-containing protein [Planctomycetota bacterium]